MAKILIIEDDISMARFVELELEHEGYEIDKATDGRVGLNMVIEDVYDLILLDILLPSLNGLEVLRRIRRTSQVPVILLTARDAVPDKVTGLDMGADDYITKPFSIEELLARIRSTLRIGQKNNNSVLKCCNLILDKDKHIVSYNNNNINLTGREFDLLYELMKNESIVLNRDTLLENVWGYDYAGETNVVDVYIRYLRSKIDQRFNIKLIRTVRGIGYVLRSEEL